MKMNAGAWVGIIGGIIGFLAGLVAVLATTGREGIYIAAAMIALFAGMGFLFYKLLFGPMLNFSRLQKTGLPGTATITAVNDTGVTINNNPQVKLTLEVKGSLGQRYITTCRTLVSRINPFVFQPGMEVPVKIDPKNEMNVIIDMNASSNKKSQQSSGQIMQTDTAALQAELEKMQLENEALKVSGRRARAIIKQYNWLGAYVNGNNPYVELEVEVLPETSASFSSKLRGVIAATSVEKYQPGKEIYVKYDLYDNSKAVIDQP